MPPTAKRHLPPQSAISHQAKHAPFHCQQCPVVFHRDDVKAVLSSNERTSLGIQRPVSVGTDNDGRMSLVAQVDDERCHRLVLRTHLPFLLDSTTSPSSAPAPVSARRRTVGA
jgi:hypothetical protein